MKPKQNKSFYIGIIRGIVTFYKDAVSQTKADITMVQQKGKILKQITYFNTNVNTAFS